MDSNFIKYYKDEIRKKFQTAASYQESINNTQEYILTSVTSEVKNFYPFLDTLLDTLFYGIFENDPAMLNVLKASAHQGVETLELTDENNPLYRIIADILNEDALEEAPEFKEVILNSIMEGYKKSDWIWRNIDEDFMISALPALSPIMLFKFKKDQPDNYFTEKFIEHCNKLELPITYIKGKVYIDISSIVDRGSNLEVKDD